MVQESLFLYPRLSEQSNRYFFRRPPITQKSTRARDTKRGVSDLGKGNDVELEQIVHEEGVSEGIFSSFLQVRGSIPPSDAGDKCDHAQAANCAQSH